MARAKPTSSNTLMKRAPDDDGVPESAKYHVFGNCVVCKTDSRGFATPHNRKPQDLVLDASEGFIPLWDKSMTLRWRFQQRALSRFANPGAIMQAVEDLMGKALLAWGDAVPLKFVKNTDLWDFEIVVNAFDNCNESGCVLASAFFPDAGRHELEIFPKMFEQTPTEQVETMAHELGHVFGLRHFFAKISETDFASEIFGKHKAFSIMNYGDKSKMTADDRKDLKKLYKKVWSGELTQINGTPIRLVKPFHTLAR